MKRGKQERQITISEQTNFTTCDGKKKDENEKNKLLRLHGLTNL